MLRLIVSFVLLIVYQFLMSPLSAAQESGQKNANRGSELTIAVASNFSLAARALVEQYSHTSADSVRLLVGSTGKHTSQIQHGLGADIFLAADAARPLLLESSGFAVAGSRFTYAVGRLALWSSDSALIDSNGRVLRSANFSRLAIANPRIAPYGLAAQQVIDELGLNLSSKLVYGESVGQAFQFASSGNAELALLALAQVKNLQGGSRWLVPNSLHKPIKQQAVMLQDSNAARKFMDFLKSEKALTLIETYGYLRP